MYIDDLDRCSDGKSVMILEAVQLLFNETPPEVPESSKEGLLAEYGGKTMYWAKMVLRVWSCWLWLFSCQSCGAWCCCFAQQSPLSGNGFCRGLEKVKGTAIDAGYKTRQFEQGYLGVKLTPLLASFDPDQTEIGKRPPFISVFVSNPARTLLLCRMARHLHLDP